MDNKTVVKHLWVMNEALIKGLKTAIFAIEKVDEFSPEKRQSIMDSLEELVSQSEKLYKQEHPPESEPEPTKH